MTMIYIYLFIPSALGPKEEEDCNVFFEGEDCKKGMYHTDVSQYLYVKKDCFYEGAVNI